jgi:hypothetical protein
MNAATGNDGRAAGISQAAWSWARALDPSRSPATSRSRIGSGVPGTSRPQRQLISKRSCAESSRARKFPTLSESGLVLERHAQKGGPLAHGTLLLAGSETSCRPPAETASRAVCADPSRRRERQERSAPSSVARKRAVSVLGILAGQIATAVWLSLSAWSSTRVVSHWIMENCHWILSSDVRNNAVSWWSYGDSNPRPLPCHGSALPTAP